MEPYTYRIGPDRALFVATCMWISAATIVGTMSYPLWAGLGEVRTVRLGAMAESQFDPFDSAEREIVRDVLNSHGVRRGPGQSWMKAFQSLSMSEVGGIAEDLGKKLGAHRDNASATRKGRRTTRATNTGKVRARLSKGR